MRSSLLCAGLLGWLLGAATAINTYVPQAPVTGKFAGIPSLSELPLTTPYISRLATGNQPEQIRVSYLSPDSVVVSWSTGEPQLGARQLTPYNTSSVPSVVRFGTSPGNLTRNATGFAVTYNQLYFGDFSFDTNYSSPLIHHVKLSALRPETVYFYQVGDGNASVSRVLRFSTVSAVGRGAWKPYRIAVWADMGLAVNATETMARLGDSNAQHGMFIGDFVYADIHTSNNDSLQLTNITYLTKGPDNSYQPRWDALYRGLEPVLSAVPYSAITGNHDIEVQSDGTWFASFDARYGKHASPANASSGDTRWFSYDLPGAHVVYLNFYAPYETGSDQYDWLVQDLEAMDRSRTPWLIVGFHTPWYHTVVSHYKEVECMRIAMEDVLYDYGADLVLSGHVHAYERTNRVYNYTLDSCGPTYITIGDAGTFGTPNLDLVTTPGKCPAPPKGPTTTFFQVAKGHGQLIPLPNCVTYQAADRGGEQGGYCPPKQPAWSAFRETDFGHGTIDVINSTHLLWQWHRNMDPAGVVADSIYVVRQLDCPNQHTSNLTALSPPTTTSG